jgi:hypothetical protein
MACTYPGLQNDGTPSATLQSAATIEGDCSIKMCNIIETVLSCWNSLSESYLSMAMSNNGESLHMSFRGNSDVG